MSTYSLSGTGVQALSSNVTAVHVTVTTLPSRYGQGTANPTNYYDVCLLRFGDATGYFDAIPVVGGPQWLAVPSGATRCGYAVKGGAVISLAEVIGGTPPFGSPGALSSLTDVALASLADAQVLTYQASTTRWINSTPSGGSSPTIYHARVSKSSDSSVSNNTVGYISFNTAHVDNDTMYSSGTPDRITIHHAGTWILTAEIRWSTGNGNPECMIELNGSTALVDVSAPASGLAACSVVRDLAVNDYLRIGGFQSSGGSITQYGSGGAYPYSSMLSAARIG